MKSNFRFVHIGPILTAFIHGNNSSKLGANTMPNNHMFDAHNVLPISNNETTVILCANALGQSIPATVTLNTVMLQYGFQVELILNTTSRAPLVLYINYVPMSFKVHFMSFFSGHRIIP